jgi:ribosomal protein S18 acetylase RimI-like enzyme
MRIRAFAAADAGACAAILATAAGMDETIDPAEFHRVTEAEEILVIDQGDGVAGFLSFYRPDRFIHHLYVAPRHRRRGIGRTLLVEALARLDGVARLKCQSVNLHARLFYRSLGWAEHAGGEDERGAWLWLQSPKRNGR